jgi:hypothetical protein
MLQITLTHEPFTTDLSGTFPPFAVHFNNPALRRTNSLALRIRYALSENQEHHKTEQPEATCDGIQR